MVMQLPPLTSTPDRLDAAYQTALAALLRARLPEGHWVGELSTSALSTATAVSALALVQKNLPPHNQFDSLIAGGLAWLEQHQNDDGGWGDTTRSISNISTTMLCRAAFHIAGAADRCQALLARAATWLGNGHGQTPPELAEAVRARYGKDRTFAVPILTTCALAGLTSWEEVTPLPFELACLPQSWFRFLNLHVVSYALPALIAIGQAVHHHRPSGNPFARMVRSWARIKSLKVLERIQPTSGGFLEATPLTSFVVLSLASIGQQQHPVAVKGAEFLVNSARPDGSWPIDTNLSTWVTTLTVNALTEAGALDELTRKADLTAWLNRQQYREKHPYTGAAPGGWAWTPLSGGVPDADDTSGALLALHNLGSSASAGISQGLLWLVDLQNDDGGWPTFCAGWGKLPFDRSGADLTGHALRAIACWWKRWPEDDKLHPFVYYGPRALSSGLAFLAAQQRDDGSWLPLWFGNQHAPADENPTYGTTRVLAAYRDLDMMDAKPVRAAIGWLLRAQNADGGWGGAPDTPSSIEETALAVDILLDAGLQAEGAVNKGLAWLVDKVEAGGLESPTPIGFYFAKLWYYEKIYPIIFTVAALGRARRRQK